MILLPDYFGYTMADDYANFVKIIVWFRMYCENRLGQEKKDYVKGFRQLLNSYDAVFQYVDQEPPESLNLIVDPFFSEVLSIFEDSTFGDNHISQIAKIILDFENYEGSGPGSFRDKCFNFLTKEDSKVTYPKSLIDATYDLLMAEKHDAVIVEAFKTVDNLLQAVLQVSPHELYGENLINAAFAPESGRLQLGTSANEQTGLRNLFSGANAFFRNPSAHRNQFKGKK